MIPENVFDEFLSSFSLVCPSSQAHFEVFEAIPPSLATDGSAALAEPAVRLWYKNDGKPSFDSFRKRLEDEIRNLGHKVTESLVGTVIALYAANPTRAAGPTSVLNSMLSGIVDGDLSQFFIFCHPPYPGFQSFKIGHFRVGELDSKKLSYRSERAGSDFSSRYEDSLVGRFAIERDVAPVRVVNLIELVKEYDVGPLGRTSEQLWNRCVEAYFQALAAAYFDDFWELLAEDQHLVIACGASYIEGQRLRNTRFAQAVSVFLNLNDIWGFVAPGSFSGLNVDFVSIDKYIPEAIIRLRDEFGITPGFVLHPPLKNYVHFISKARRYLNDGLPDEAFVHYVIALELLFGERHRTTESVTKRAATIVFRPLGLPIVDADKDVGKLYEARSRYVHSGQKVDPKLLGKIEDVCKQVLWALLRRTRTRAGDEKLVENWNKDLDYLYSAVVAGKAVADEDFRSSGILPAVTGA